MAVGESAVDSVRIVVPVRVVQRSNRKITQNKANRVGLIFSGYAMFATENPAAHWWRYAINKLLNKRRIGVGDVVPYRK